MKNQEKAVCLIFAMIGMLLFSAPVLAQQPGRAESEIRKGIALLEQGDRKKAEKAFKAALKADERALRALFSLGKMAREEREWSRANGYYEKILDADDGNIEARYYRAICYRETGKFKPRFLNDVSIAGIKLDYNKSEDHFARVIETDSLYRDVIYQYALLQRYRKRFHDAIGLAHLQTRLKPSLSKARLGLYDIYRHYLINTGREEAVAWLQAQPEPHARFFAAEKLRREGYFDAADSIYRVLLEERVSISTTALHLARAKAAYAKSRKDFGEEQYWRAVGAVRDETDAGLVFTELKHILSDAEAATADTLRGISAWTAFFRAVWTRRNPTPAAQHNPRLAEHYRRYLFAEKHYEYVGFRSWVNNPDKLGYLRFPRSYLLNTEFNDKGLIFLRHGEPGDRAQTAGFGVPSNESWIYWQTEESPEMTFHFIYDENLIGNLWRLSSTLPHPAMLEDRLTWDNVYYRLLSSGTEVERTKLEYDLAMKSRESVDVGMTTDRHTWAQKTTPLDVRVTTASFRGKDGISALEIYFGLPLAQIGKALGPSKREAVVEQGYAVHRLDWQPVTRQLQQTALSLPASPIQEDLIYTDLYRVALPPDSYKVALHVRPEATSLLGGYADLGVDVPDYSADTLMISDILLASSITPAETPGTFVRHRLNVVPNPTRQSRADRPVHVYFEVYKLKTGADGGARFEVAYTVTRKRKKRSITRLFGLLGGGGKSSVTLKADRTAPGSFSPEFIAIDVEKLGKGEVTLEIEVRDRNAGMAVRKSVDFSLYK